MPVATALSTKTSPHLVTNVSWKIRVAVWALRTVTRSTSCPSSTADVVSSIKRETNSDALIVYLPFAPLQRAGELSATSTLRRSASSKPSTCHFSNRHSTCYSSKHVPQKRGRDRKLVLAPSLLISNKQLSDACFLPAIGAFCLLVFNLCVELIPRA